MDEFYSENGIFIHSQDLESECMIECLQSIFAICPDIKITSVVCDEIINGYRFCFEDSEVRHILEKRYLTLKNRQIAMYPLTTSLLILNVFSRNDDFEYDLTKAIQDKFGTVLNFEKLPGDADNQTEKSTSSFLVNIDVPEIKDLSIFKRNGYPRMFIRLPSVFKTFQVVFWCRCCRKGGHTHQECFEMPSQSDTSLNNKSNQDTVDRQPRTQLYPEKHFTASVTSLRAPTDSTATVEKETGMEGGSSNENNCLHSKDKSNNLASVAVDSHMLTKNLRKEEESNIKSSEKENSSLTNNDETSKTNELSMYMPVRSSSLRKKEVDENSCPFPPATSTTEDDEIKCLESFVVSQYEDTEDTISECNGTSKEPTYLMDSGEYSFQSPAAVYEHSPLSIQQQPGAFMSSLQRQYVGDTTVLSEQLQKCIDDSCNIASCVLDREKLDVFFNHVRKKVNPIPIAVIYTKNVKGLKEQLIQIRHLYYTSKPTSTREDTAFIKWLSGLIERFDGNFVKKRKSAAKVDDGRRKKMA